MGDLLHDRLSSSWGLYGSQSISRYMRKHNLPVKYIEFDGYGHEPQVAKGGTYNQNMSIINQEINTFLYNNLSKKNPDYHIEGNMIIRKNTTSAIYQIAGEHIENISWHADGGLILSTSGNGIYVVWYNTRNEGRISACITDTKGMNYKKEMKVRILTMDN